MATVVLPGPLSRRTGGEDRIALPGGTAGDVLKALEAAHPDIRGWVLDERGRLRRHVNVFVNSERAALDHPVADGDEVYVLQAISGGAGSDAELLVGTRKGLYVLRGSRGDAMRVVHREFGGDTVEYAMRDPRSGRYFASVTSGHFGPRLFLARDPAGPWEQAEGPAFPADAGASVTRIWVVVPGSEKEVLWAGAAPAALFKSADGGRTWALNRALWDDPTRPKWEGGAGGLALHSICPWPGDPKRLAIGISAAGVWITEDGGESWSHHVEGLVARYVPEDTPAGEVNHCVHKIERSPVEPTTLYMQFHGGVYRSDDAGATWIDIGADGGLPADFGFPLVADPGDPNRAFVIPLVADVDRVTPEGRLRVYETRDRGASWRPLTRGLPQENAWATILRQAFCHDGGEPLGLYFGTESGSVYGSADGGESWTEAARQLPPVVSVRSA